MFDYFTINELIFTLKDTTTFRILFFFVSPLSVQVPDEIGLGMECAHCRVDFQRHGIYSVGSALVSAQLDNADDAEDAEECCYYG